MNDHTKLQKGSPSRDEFKVRHKLLRKELWSLDIDFLFVEKSPYPDIIAAIDYKSHGDTLTFAEVIAYNALTIRGIPIYIVSGDAETGEFEIKWYVGGHHQKPRYELVLMKTTANWKEFEAWEIELRAKRKKRFEQ